MMKFRKKPVVIDALQFTGHNVSEVFDFMAFTNVRDDEHAHTLTIPTLEGEMTANIGDWIIRGIQGEFYPCKPEIFTATYERVE